MNSRDILTHSKNKLFLVWLTIVSVILATQDMFSRIGPSSLRMATASSDDNFLIFAQSKLNPNHFKFDFYGQVISQTQSASLLSRIYAYIVNSIGVEPKYVWNLATYSQRFTLYLAIGMLAWTWSRNLKKTIFIQIIFAAVQPYYWNIGWFGALDEQPYPMWQSLPFLISCFCFLQLQKYKLSVVSLLIAAAIHPSFAATFVPVLLIMLHNKLQFSKQFLYISAQLILIFATLFTFIKLAIPSQSKLPQDIVDIAFTNPHLTFSIPWETIYVQLSARAWILTILMVFFIYASSRMQIIKLENKFSIQIFSLIVTYTVLNYVFYKLHWVAGVTLALQRFSAFTSTIGFVALLLVCFKLLNNSKISDKLMALIALVFPAPILLLVFATYVAFTFIEPFQYTIRKWILNIAFCIEIAILSLPIVDFTTQINLDHLNLINPMNQGFASFLIPSLYLRPALRLVLLVLVCMLLFQKYLSLEKLSSHVKKLGLFCLMLVILFAEQTGMKYQYAWSFSGENISKVTDYRNAQLWARNHTSTDSVFFIDGAFSNYYTWRTLSARSVANPNPIWSLYNYPTYVNDFNNARKDYWRKAVNSGKVKYLGEWKQGFFCSSQYLYSIDYVLVQKENRFTEFDDVYSNNTFIIQRVKC